MFTHLFKLFLLPLFPCCLYAQAAKNNFIKLDVKKRNFSPGENISFNLRSEIPSCNNTTKTVYVELLNSYMEIAARRVFQVHRGAEEFQLPVADTGVYVLRAYTKEQGLQHAAHIPQVIITIGIKNTDDQQDTPKVFVYPEAGRALENFTNRFTIILHSNTGEPLPAKLLIKNKLGQTVGIASTDKQGYASLELPIVKDDTLRIQNQQGKTLYQLYKNPEQKVFDNGFSLAVKESNGMLYVEMRKGESEQKRTVKLFTYFSNTDKLLYEASAVFREDTLIVETVFPAKGLEHQLLRMVLKDEKGVPIAERLFIPEGNMYHSKISAALHHQLECTVYSLSGFNNLQDIKPKNVNDYLMASAIIQEEDAHENDKGFSLFFSAPSLSGQSVSYQLQDSSGLVLETGNVKSDSAGVMELDELHFKGKATMIFYLKQEQNRALIKEIPFAVADYANRFAYDLLSSSLKNKMVKTEAVNTKDTIAINNPAFIKNSKDLKELVVEGRVKTRKEELEDKYISNGFFRSQNAIDIDVGNDPLAIHYDINNYLTKFVPGVRLIKDNRGRTVISYRQGEVAIFLDEIPMGHGAGLPFTNLHDIGYIKFIRGAVSGLNESGGALQRGQSNIGGTTGTLLVYTKKDSKVKKTIPFRMELEVTGYE
jgi:hypothetical protein